MSISGTPSRRANVSNIHNISCLFCGEVHHFKFMPANLTFVYYVENQNVSRTNPYSRTNLYSNIYNPRWRQHLNFSLRGNQAQQESSNTTQFPHKGNFLSGFSRPNQQKFSKPMANTLNSMENLIKKIYGKE